MKKLLSTLVVASALTTASFADSMVVDLTVGAGQLDFDQPTVRFGDSSTATFALALDKPKQNYQWAQFSHLAPIIPNVRVEMVDMVFEGTATTSGTLNGINVAVNSATKLDLTHQDIIAYWGIPFSTWIPMIDAADFGIGVKQFDGSLTVTGVTTETLDAMLPYGYARLHITPPLLGGIGFEAEIKTLSLDSTISFTENIYKIDWRFEAPIPVIDLAIGVEGGMRQMSFQADVDGSSAFADVEFESVFFGVFAYFGI